MLAGPAGATTVVTCTVDVAREERGSHGDMFMLYRLAANVDSLEPCGRKLHVRVEALVRYKQMLRLEKAVQQHLEGIAGGRHTFPKAKRLDAMRDRKVVAERRVNELRGWMDDLLKRPRIRLLTEALIEFQLVERDATVPTPSNDAVLPSPVALPPPDAADVRPRNISMAESLFSSVSGGMSSPVASGSLPETSEPSFVAVAHRPSSPASPTSRAEDLAEDFFGAVRRQPKTLQALHEELDRRIFGQRATKAGLVDFMVVQQNKPMGHADQTTRHFIINGSPGTGKTTLGKCLTELLYQNGVIKRNHFVATTGQGLTGQFVGQTKEVVADTYAKAKGGVLFIDEAHALAKAGYGSDVIQSFLKCWEQADPIFILAGYPDEMQQLLRMDRGLSRRISRTFELANYSVSDLAEMFWMRTHTDMSFYVAGGWVLDESVTRDEVRAAFRRAYPCDEYNATHNGALVYGTEGSFYGLVQAEACRALQDAHERPEDSAGPIKLLGMTNARPVTSGAPHVLSKVHLHAAAVEARRRTCDELRREASSVSAELRNGHGLAADAEGNLRRLLAWLQKFDFHIDVDEAEMRLPPRHAGSSAIWSPSARAFFPLVTTDVDGNVYHASRPWSEFKALHEALVKLSGERRISSLPRLVDVQFGELGDLAADAKARAAQRLPVLREWLRGVLQCFALGASESATRTAGASLDGKDKDKPSVLTCTELSVFLGVVPPPVRG